MINVKKKAENLICVIFHYERYNHQSIIVCVQCTYVNLLFSRY